MIIVEGRIKNQTKVLESRNFFLENHPQVLDVHSELLDSWYCPWLDPTEAGGQVLA